MIATLFATAGVAIAALVVLLSVATVVRRYRRERRERRRATLVEPLRQVLVRLVTDPTGDDPSEEHVELLATPPRTWRALEPTVLDMLRKVRGESRDRLVALVVAHGTVERMRRRTRRPGAVGRAHAAELLGLLRRREGRDDLVRLLSDRDPEVRLVAARALGELGDTSAAPALLASLVTERSVPLRVVARSLARLGPQTGSTLVEGLRSPDALVRSVCAEISGLLGVTAAQESLLAVTDADPDDDVRIRAARALGRIGLPSALPVLVAATAPDRPAPLRAVAAGALGDLGGTAPVQFLEALLDDADLRVSTNAGRAMTRAGAAGLLRLRQVAASAGDAGACAREALAVHALSHGLSTGPSRPIAPPSSSDPEATVPPRPREPGLPAASAQDARSS
ncbi:MAG TPA: HEAT repeat domain-containing protein [Actinomycetales bacterium]|nr:HEAT repeat domain-containing protein [Actinomycetales bacterium]